MINANEETKKLEINPNFGYSQHFLVSKEIISDIANFSEANENDIILEIGAGTGNITKELAKTAKKIIAIEIDSRFEAALSQMPKNVTPLFADIIKFLPDTKREGVTKIVANPPFDLCEALAKYLLFARHIKKAILIVPKTFAAFLENSPIYPSFLKIKRLKEIPKDAFSPIADTSCEIISLEPRPNYEEDKDEKAFVKRKLYMQEGKKLKNALRETIIDLYYIKHKKQLTKKNASEIIAKLKLEKNALETKVEMIIEMYDMISSYIEKLGI